MKTRPILFSAPMVRALLEGRKTQTRRILKPVGHDDGFVIVQQDNCKLWPYRSDDGESLFVTIRGQTHEIPMECPYGQPGDMLYVRETWREIAGLIEYRATLSDRQSPDNLFRWRPSIHMPRWASRITLELVRNVRVERLQDISEEDAKAEGLRAITKDGKLVKYGIPDRDGLPGTDNHGWPWVDWNTDPVAAYRRLWESVNGPGSWAANPWVWVIEFRRVEQCA